MEHHSHFLVRNKETKQSQNFNFEVLYLQSSGM
ncbi:uncharacterized protein G2W53_018963 [Senna tora]|uniref:Uncharacterized protein n=1 Tax=Senna tora TaxID=362788 RepID=A0A834TU33_9FABA|nr:uncharacterized protein G2W53_018963 [Senna tora]